MSDNPIIFSGLTDAEAADYFNAPSIQIQIPVEIKTIEQYLFDQDILVDLLDHASNQASPAASKKASKYIERLFIGKLSHIDTANPAFVGWLDDLVSANILSAEQRQYILDMGSVEISPVQYLKLTRRPVKIGHIQMARSS